MPKTKSIEELMAWAGEREGGLSWKLDGLTLVLTYDGGELTKVMTRGNGTIGTNITFLKESIAGFPLSIPYKGHMVVRGEAVISYTDFEQINDLIEDDDEKYANPRNLASGTLNLEDPQAVAERHIGFNAFTLVYIEDDIVSWGERMDLLSQMGFTVVDREKLTREELSEAVERWTKRVEDGQMDLPVDGLVLAYEDTAYASEGSVTGHHATRAGYAFKWADVAVDTKLSYIEWSCAASTISPVAVFEPVQIEGTTVSRASLCNLSEMDRLGIGAECTLSVIKANKIIPKCIAVKDAIGIPAIPEICPVCGAPTEIHESPGGTKTLHCSNPACSAKHLKRFTRFVSKNAMDVDGLSIQTMLKFMNEGFLHEFADIYHLPEHFDKISQMDGFGEKSCENMGQAIAKSRQVHPVNLIYALCIPMIGVDAAKKIIARLGWEGFMDRLSADEGYEDIDGIGAEKSNSIRMWYADEGNQRMLDRLLAELTVQKVQPQAAGGRCAGLTFVITGDVHHYKNRDEFKAYVESQGGKVTGSVSKKTSYLVNNDAASTSSKNRKARELGIAIITEDEFVERF
ncbi:MAG: NAD-dependent DNA ligase LigA [Clostridiales bacterium]|nr:NAD-dependent DNA ligase LigA [Clostridiales bacterium]